MPQNDKTLMKRLEKIFRPWAIPNITGLIIAGQIVLYVAYKLQAAQGVGGNVFSKLELDPSKVLEGEVWRVVTFLFIPFSLDIIGAIFGWLIFYMFGNGLESIWGTVRYNLFLWIGFLANVAASFLTVMLPAEHIANNGFFYATVFLAFARINPHYVLHIFFILPIQIKWLALLMWLGYAFAFIQGDWMNRLLIVASVANYLLFFGKEHWQQIKSGQRRRTYQAKTKAATKSLVHECLVCGLNSETAPRTLFRYCSKCDGQCCYCPDHIHDHEHVTGDGKASSDTELAESGEP